MDFSDPRLIVLLRDVNRARQEHELTARLTGENFNIFNILGLSTAEVRTHSAFLAELLNPEGSHGQGAVYLRLFLKRLSDVESITNSKAPAKIDAFQAEGAKVVVEYPIGAVDQEDGTGGRLDMLLDDGYGKLIVIENKIHAVDQPGQLLRYHNFCEKNTGATLIYLIYLTKYGEHATEISTCNVNFSYTCLSYKEHILRWLDDCHRASVSLPVIRESILQYKCLIQELTHQSARDKVIEQAKKLILADRDCVEAVDVLLQAMQVMIWECKSCFVQRMNEVLPPTPLPLGNGVTIWRIWGEDSDGVWIGFRAVNGKDEKAVDAPRYRDEFVSLMAGRTGFSEQWNVGWFNPEPFTPRDKFEKISKTLILSFYKNGTEPNKDEMKKFVDKVKSQAEDVTRLLLDKIK